jgi:hypothetical protein
MDEVEIDVQIRGGPNSFRNAGDSCLRGADPTVVLLGDSLLGNNSWPQNDPAANSFRLGAFGWANALLGSRFDLILSAAVGGERTDQIHTRLVNEVLPLKPGWVVYQAGPNDMGQGISESTMLANILASWDAALAAGARVVALSIPPRSGFGPQICSANQKLMLAARLRPGVVWVDIFPTLVDASTGAGKTSLYQPADIVHPNLDGCYAQALKIVEALDGIAPPSNVLRSDQSTWGANLLPNGLFTGTGGTISSGTGIAATGWIGSGSGSPSFEKVARTDENPGEWQRLTVSGTGSPYSSIRRTDNQAAHVGKVVYGVAEIRINDDWDGAHSFRLALQFRNNASAEIGYVEFGDPADVTFEGYTVKNQTLVIKTPLATVPANTVYITVELRVYSQGASGSMDISRAGIYEVTP